MSPITHFLTGWLVANASDQINRRERAIITLAAVAPDLDGLGVVADFLTRSSEHPLTLYSDYHHMEWPVGVKCMAEFHCNGGSTGDSVRVGMEAREIAVRDGFRFS